MFNKSCLKNGLTIVSEKQDYSRSVSLGILVLTGTRHEKPDEAGISHFIEHLVFKGTKNRTAYQISKSLEALGGELNAYTTREYTFYHALVLKDHWPLAFEVLADLVKNMDLKPHDLEVERSVILQEISMSEDNLEELIYDIYLEKALPKNSLGNPILGHVESISTLTKKKLIKYYEDNYISSKIIISGAGAIEHERIVELANKYLNNKSARFSDLKSSSHLSSRDLSSPHLSSTNPSSSFSKKLSSALLKEEASQKNNSMKLKHHTFRKIVDKPTEQLHMLLGFRVPSFQDSDRFASFIVNALLGGGMTSKLYQSIREKRGLVYSIYSSLFTFVDFGMINIYAACEPKNMKAVYDNVIKEIEKIKKRDLKKHEIEIFKTQIIGSLLLGSDDVENRMNSIAINEMVFQSYKPIDMIIEEIKKVSADSVNHFLHKYLKLEKMSGILLGAQASDHKKWFLEKRNDPDNS